VLITQFVENHFVDSYTPTIENTVRKNVRYGDKDYLLEIVDTSGQVAIMVEHFNRNTGPIFNFSKALCSWIPWLYFCLRSEF
jgi:GTPase SAR1 family protein